MNKYNLITLSVLSNSHGISKGCNKKHMSYPVSNFLCFAVTFCTSATMKREKNLKTIYLNALQKNKSLSYVFEMLSLLLQQFQGRAAFKKNRKLSYLLLQLKYCVPKYSSEAYSTKKHRQKTFCEHRKLVFRPKFQRRKL